MPIKREVLRVVMSPYDPVGMLAPIIIAANVIVQRLWCIDCKWDESILDEILPVWQN